VSIIDEHTRECLTSLVERSVTADALIDELDRLALTRGYPAVLRCDNGPELACEAMADWAGEHVVLSFIPPGEPWRNGYVESFNGRVRDECLNINIFWSLVQARMVITDWKDDYNHRRRHSSLGYQTCTARILDCWLTCTVVGRLDTLMVGWAGAAQDRLPADLPDTRPDRRAGSR
jgi:putative transposase